MLILRGILLLISVFAYIISGLLLHLFIIFLKPGLRRKLISNWNRLLAVTLREILGIKLHLEGKLSYFKESGNFIVVNHVSYLDGVILSSLFPVIFVTKLQVKGWPVFGWMSQVGSTIFIDRKRKLGSLDFMTRISNVLKEGVNVLFFPEGTSTDGSRIQAFQQGYFQAPLNSGSAVIPVTIQYTKINSQDISLANRDKVFWYGQVKFAQHLLVALRQKEIEARIIIHPKIETSAYDPRQPGSRKELSEAALEAIARDFIPVK